MKEDITERLQAMFTSIAKAVRPELPDSDRDAVRDLVEGFVDDKLNDDLGDRVEAIYASMAEGALPAFSDSNLESLHCVVMFTLEFEDYLRRGLPRLKAIQEWHERLVGLTISNQRDQLDMDFVNGATFSAIDSFRSVSGAYNGLIGSIESSLVWGIITVESLKELFRKIYPDFVVETDFLKKCRLLLDLFRIQIVFAAVSYGGG
jgi:hypothetical protein